MNKLHEEARVRAAKTVLAKILEALARVTPKHFADEEVYMESIAFPCLTSHRLIHKTLLQKFGEHRARFEKKGQLDEDFFQFLRHWLKAHIIGLDTKHGQHKRAA